MRITPIRIKSFQKKILSFYEELGRDLPWRNTTDRYRILVSEIMLQQTQASRVVPKYETWIREFPTAESLAQAPLSKVLALWSGLGYNSRAKRLQDCAKAVVEQYAGILPDAPEELMKLPGIGPYTSRSILIFADNKDLATVDTNIRRILIHEFGLDESISDKELFTFAQTLVPKGRSRDWHNALMDYGATLLTSKNTGIRPKTRQSTFKGSSRYYRGQILKLLILQKQATLQELIDKFPQAPRPIEEIAAELVKEGLIIKTSEGFSIGE